MHISGNITFVSVVKPQLLSSTSHILDSDSAFFRHWIEQSQNLVHSYLNI